MKTTHKIAVVISSLAVMLIADIPILPVQLVPDAEAIFGVRRRAFRRGAFFGASMGALAARPYGMAYPPPSMGYPQSMTAQQQSMTAQQQSATAQQQSMTAQQQSLTAQQQAASAAVPTPPPAATGKPLPLGTVVATLPAGCTSTPVGGVEYFYCGGNFYRAAFHSNTLVYVTAKP